MSWARCLSRQGGKASCRRRHLGRRAPPHRQYGHLLPMRDARHGPPSYSATMRPDMPYALGGVAVGALLLGNAVIAPDAGPVRPLDVVLILAAAAAVALCRRFP